MLSVIGPEQFKTSYWKNGKGQTTELAINTGGLLDDFEWRISIADMTENGEFSSFNGYRRHLLLLKGAGLKLIHNRKSAEWLKSMEVAEFDGANQTTGELLDGPVQNFNVMTRKTKASAVVTSHQGQESFDVVQDEALFIYATEHQLMVSAGCDVVAVNVGSMVRFSSHKHPVVISGSAYIVIRMTSLKNNID